MKWLLLPRLQPLPDVGPRFCLVLRAFQRCHGRVRRKPIDRRRRHVDLGMMVDLAGFGPNSSKADRGGVMLPGKRQTLVRE
jgi:hypothetical protein